MAEGNERAYRSLDGESTAAHDYLQHWECGWRFACLKVSGNGRRFIEKNK